MGDTATLVSTDSESSEPLCSSSGASSSASRPSSPPNGFPWDSCDSPTGSEEDNQEILTSDETSLQDEDMEVVPGFFYQLYDSAGSKLVRHPLRLLSVGSELCFAGRFPGDPVCAFPAAGLRLQRFAVCPGDLLTFADRSPGAGPAGRTGEALVTEVEDQQPLVESDPDALRFAVKFHANLRYTDLTNMNYRQVSARKNFKMAGTATLLPTADCGWRLAHIEAHFSRRPSQRVLLEAAQD